MSVRELLRSTPDNISPMLGDWVNCVARHMLPGLSITPSGPGRSVLSAFDFAGARLWYAASGAQRIVRSHQNADVQFLPVAIVQLSGSARVTQAGTACDLGAGDFTYIDAAKPLILEQCSDFEQLYVQLPPGAYARDGFAPARLMGADQVDHMYFQLVTTMWRTAPEIQPIQHSHALDAFIAMSRMTGACHSVGMTPRLHCRVEQAMAYIEKHLSDERLTAEDVADQQHVSRRYLDELFVKHGYRLNGWIWERRLQRAATRLGSPGAQNVTLLEVAFDSGFKSSSHFSRLFSKRFGMPPKCYRQKVLSGSL